MAWPGARRTYAQIRQAEVASGFYCDDELQVGPTPLTAPSGYTELLEGSTVVVPVPTYQVLNAPQFIAVGIPPSAIGVGQWTGYVPTFYGDGRIGHHPGGFGIGTGAIGRLRPYHGRLTISAKGIGVFAIGADSPTPAPHVYVETFP